MSPAELVANAKAVILDFDGPMCSVFAGVSARDVANELASFTLDLWAQHDEVLEGVPIDSDDPFEVLQVATASSVARAGHVSARLRQLETAAVEHVSPTEGLVDFLSSAEASGQALAVASNNSTGAIKHWLKLQGLEHRIAYVAGRGIRSDQLKPDPLVLNQAMSALSFAANGCVFLGDSLFDLEAARAVSMPFVGFANKPEKAKSFHDEGCLTVVTNYGMLMAANL